MKLGKILSIKAIYLIAFIFSSQITFAQIAEKEIDILEAIKNDININQNIEETEHTKKQEENPKLSSKNNLKPAKTAYIFDFSPIIDEILPTVVNIKTFDFEEKGQNIDNSKTSSIGSGYIHSSDGFIVTSYHVVKNFKKIEVTLYDDKKYQANLIAYDSKTDLALLKINATNLKVAKIGDSDKTKIGNLVLVVGNPYGLGQSVSLGIISAKGRSLKNNQHQEFIQTDAAINDGNSGGPMFNINGEVIGINTTILSPSGGSVGLGFAVPSQTLENIVNQLKVNGRVVRGWVGVTVRDISQEIAEAMNLENTDGAFINDVTKNGPADIAGIKPSDIVTKIDDIEIKQMKTLSKVISSYKIGQTAIFEVIRQGKIKKFKIEVAESPNDILSSNLTEKTQKNNSQNIYEFLGITVTNLTSDHKNQLNIAQSTEGVLVTNVNEKSQAFLKGVEIGDIILMVNQNNFNNIKQLKKLITKDQLETDKLMLFIKRSDTNYPIVLDFNKKND